MPENGNYVTRGEFNIVYDTLKDVQKDVKSLLSAQASTRAIESERQSHADRRAIWKPTLIASVLSVGSGLALHFF